MNKNGFVILIIMGWVSVILLLIALLFSTQIKTSALLNYSIQYRQLYYLAESGLKISLYRQEHIPFIEPSTISYNHFETGYLVPELDNLVSLNKDQDFMFAIVKYSSTLKSIYRMPYTMDDTYFNTLTMKKVK